MGVLIFKSPIALSVNCTSVLFLSSSQLSFLLKTLVMEGGHEVVSISSKNVVPILDLMAGVCVDYLNVNIEKVFPGMLCVTRLGVSEQCKA